MKSVSLIAIREGKKTKPDRFRYILLWMGIYITIEEQLAIIKVIWEIQETYYKNAEKQFGENLDR